MRSYQNLIQQFGTNGDLHTTREFVHATMAGYPNHVQALEKAVDSLVTQVDTLHVFLNEFETIPEFLDRDKIYITRSQDFGLLGECGKYYWTDDLDGYQFICSDTLIYPPEYVENMISKIEQYMRKSVVGAGGYLIKVPFASFDPSTVYLPETGVIPADTPVPVLSDLALAYHSKTLHVSRHFFYQPELSSFWFSILGLEQHVPFICSCHSADWITSSGKPSGYILQKEAATDYRSFLIKSYFILPGAKKAESKSININSCFDKIYVMNLDRRPDRWKNISLITARHHLKLTRFPAVDGSKEPVYSSWQSYFNTTPRELPEGIEPLSNFTDKFLKYRHYVARVHFMESKFGRKAMQSPGAWGYALTYIRMLKDAIAHDYERIMIMDDDVILHKSFNSEFEKHYQSLPEDWKLIMLGAMQHQWEPYITPYSELLYHCHGSSVASHAIGMTKKVFLPLLFYAEKLDLPIDEGAVFHVQNIYSRDCFVCIPNLAIQDMRESDISSSAMKQEDVDKWIKLFRWNPDDYDTVPLQPAALSTSPFQTFLRFIKSFFRRSDMVSP
jgi:GR25 family glycosyltransferase involved in LPS biosynthesis